MGRDVQVESLALEVVAGAVVALLPQEILHKPVVCRQLLDGQRRVALAAVGARFTTTKSSSGARVCHCTTTKFAAVVLLAHAARGGQSVPVLPHRRARQCGQQLLYRFWISA